MENMAETSAGMSRRTLIKRGAVVGGTLIWAAPVIDSFASPASAGTPLGKGLSYVAFIYNCGGVERRFKFDLTDEGTAEGCDIGNTFLTPGGCNLRDAAFDEAGDCEDFEDDFVVDVLPGGEIQVTFSDSADSTCFFVAGEGVGKCGSPHSPPSEGDCVDGVVGGGGSSITFGTCPA